jgi:hypothetical protein
VPVLIQRSCSYSGALRALALVRDNWYDHPEKRFMFAINHAATALIINKVFKDVPILWILISVQFMELLWVSLNYLGIEKTTTEKEVKYVGNIHLSYMPFSHSVLTMTGMSVLSWFVISKGFGKPEIGLAVGIGIASHLVLDLVTHSKDMAIVPYIKGPKFGLGLYADFPRLAFLLEIGYGTACWWIYGGEYLSSDGDITVQRSKSSYVHCCYSRSETKNDEHAFIYHQHSLCTNCDHSDFGWITELSARPSFRERALRV